MLLQQEELPFMEVDANDPKKTETLTSFWEVDDIFTFENMGFSLNVDDKKYLACPECELGPLGFQDLNTKKSFLRRTELLKRLNPQRMQSNNEPSLHQHAFLIHQFHYTFFIKESKRPVCFIDDFVLVASSFRRLSVAAEDKCIDSLDGPAEGCFPLEAIGFLGHLLRCFDVIAVCLLPLGCFLDSCWDRLIFVEVLLPQKVHFLTTLKPGDFFFLLFRQTENDVR